MTEVSDTTADERDSVTPVSDRIHDEPADTAKPLGFVGLGAMGLPMAVAAARRHALLGCDADPGRLAQLVDEVGQRSTVHTTPVAAEVAARCDVIALVLTGSAIPAAMGEMGSGLRPGTLVIDMGSSDPDATRRLAAELGKRDVRFIDAFAAGSIEQAHSGTLAILVGGADADVNAALPYLRAMGATIIRTGPVGSAHAIKKLNTEAPG